MTYQITVWTPEEPPQQKSTNTQLSTTPRFGNRPDLAHLSRILALSRGCYQQLINV